MNKLENFFITVPVLLLFHLPGVSFGQDQIQTTTLTPTETSDKSSFHQGDDQKITHYFTSHTFKKLANLRFLAITNEFSQANDERPQPLFDKLLPENFSATSFLRNLSELKNTKSNSFGKSYDGYTQVWSSIHYRYTSLVNRNITMLRRFKYSDTSKYHMSPVGISTFTGLKISMKW